MELVLQLERKTDLPQEDYLVTWDVLLAQGQLPFTVASPAKRSPRERQGEAVRPTCSHLSEGDAVQELHPLRAGLGGALLPQAQLPVAVTSPGKQPAIYKEKAEKLRTANTLEYQIQVETATLILQVFNNYNRDKGG